MRARPVIVSLLAACVLVAAGCGGGTESTSSAQPITYEALAQSATTTADATSGRFSFDVSLAFPGSDDPFGFSGEGAFDEQSGRASFAVDMSSLAKLLGGFFAGLAGPNADGAPDFDDPAGWKVEVVQDGDVSYVKLPAIADQLPEGKSWVRARKGEASPAGTFDFEGFDEFTQSDPRELLDALRAVSGDVEAVGTEELHGTPTTHYRAVVDAKELEKMAATGKAASGSLVDSLTTDVQVDEVPIDVWLDENGLVRKLALEIEASDAATGQAGGGSVAFEMWDYGEPVEIDLPPPSEVADAASVRR